MIVNWVGIKNKIFITLFIVYIVSCYTPPIRKIPQFNYNKLLEKHYRENLKDPFPIIVQPSEENDFSVTDDGYMVYSSNEGGNYDLWLRDLNTILKIKLIEHPAKQYRPFLKKISKDKYVLLYVSDDQDINGDIYLTIINPRQIIDLYINKRRQINFWDYSINISNYIEQVFSKEEKCRGKYLEDFPVMSKNLNEIYFISNRCTDKFNLWKLTLKDFKPHKKPQIILEKEIYYLSSSENYLSFSIMENHQFTSKIGLFDINNNQLTVIEPKVLNKNLSGISLKPEYKEEKKLVYFIHIEKDTNGNNKIDPYDKASILAINNEDNIVSQIIQDNFRIYDFNISNFLNGSLFYISDNYLQRDIFLTSLEGNIPKKNTPFEQYELSQQYKNQSNYELALQSVITYFFHHKDYPLIEGYVLFDLLKYLRLTNKTERLKYYINFYEIRKKENPLLSIFFKLKEIREKKKFNLLEIQSIEKQYLNLKIEDKTIKDFFYYQIGKIVWNINPPKAIEYFSKVSENSMYDSDIAYYIFYYQFKIKKQPLSKIDDSIIKKIRKDINNIIKFSQLVLLELKKYNQNKINQLRNINNLFIKNYYDYTFAEKLYFKNQLQESLKELEQIRDLNQNQYLKLKVLKLKIQIYKRLGMEKELLSTRHAFINTYNKKFNIELDEEEIQSLINSSNEFVNKYRKSAQLIYQTIEKNINEGINLTESNMIEIGVLQKDIINEFCAPDSVAGKLIDDYNYPEYEQRYAILCKNLEAYKNKSQIPVALAFELNQLMYLSSYAYANLINILFINLHQSEIFLDYHQKWSIYYHRLKVELAVERFNYLLDWQEKQALFLTKEELTSLLIEKDPFAGTIFNDLLYGYREVASKMAQETFEYSVLYGHAYTLVRKSMEREKFYDSLFRKGYTISNAELIKRKRNILLELKEAEYQLLYILTLEPTNEDAALLLSYLYAYIDYRKEQNILNPPGYIDRLYRFFTRTKPRKLTDKIFYRDLYSTTFPEKLFEKNITILENTLSLRKLENLPISPEIYLNLANNYFRIYNYKKANEYYNNITNNTYIFTNDLQKSLFYFYYAKSHFYEGNYNEAIYLFEKSYQYLSEIFQQKQSEYNIKKIQFKQTSNLLNNLNLFQNKNIEKIKNDIELFKLNLITIKIYLALTKFYNNDYSSAIIDLNVALEELDQLNSIKSFNIYNLMALNYFYNFDFINAIKVANIAIEEAKKYGLSRNDDLFIPQTVGGRFLGLFLNFGEDFTVIGDSRIPHEISSLRSYEISLGILQNAYDNIGDIDHLLDIISKKKSILEQKDLDLLLGKEAYISLLNQEANIYYKMNQYEIAYNLFEKASKLSYKYNFTKDYFINFKNMFYVIFDEIENHIKYNHKIDNSVYLNKLNQLYDILNKFKKEYYSLREKEYISIRKTENPDYELKQRDKEILLKQVELELRDFYHIEGLIFYYRGIITRNQEQLLTSIQLLDKIIHLYKKEENINRLYYRINLNYFKAKIEYYKLTKNNDFSAIINEISYIYPEYLEYGFTTELIEINQIYGDIYYILNQCDLAISYYRKAIEFIDNHIIYIQNPSRIEPLIYKYKTCLWQKKQYKEIIQIKEKFRYYKLHHLFFNSKLVFNDPLTTQLFQEITKNILLTKYLKRIFINKRLKKEDTTLIKQQIENLETKIIQYKKELARTLPYIEDYILFKEKEIFNNIGQNQYLYLWYDGNNKCLSIYNYKIKVNEIHTLNDLQNCIINNKDIVLIPDRFIYHTKLKEYYNYLIKNYNIVIRTSIFDNTPVYIDSQEDLKYITNINIFNHSKDTIIKEQDIKELPIFPVNYLLNLSDKGIGIYFKNKPTFSKVVLHKQIEKEIFFKKYIPFLDIKHQTINFKTSFIFDSIMLAYDLFSHLGVATIIDPEGYLWGIAGYNEKQFIDYKKQLAKEYFQEGLKIFKNNPEAALKYFSMSNSYNSDIKTRIYILGALIRIKDPDAIKYQQVLQKEILSQNSKIDLFRYYIIIINSYAYLRDYERLTNFINELNNIYKDSRKLSKLNITMQLLKELSLNNPDYKKIESIIQSESYDTSFTDIIIEELYKHGFYYLSEKLSSKYSEYKEFSIKNKIHQTLLEENTFPLKYLLNDEYKDQEINKWKYIVLKKIDYIIDNLRVKNIQNQKYYKARLQFYQTLKENYNDNNFSIEKFICKDDICSNLTEMEKTILFFFSIEAIPYDTNHFAWENLNILIKNFYKQSCFKGNIYLNKAISKYLEYENYEKAFQLYNQYKSYYNCIWHNEGSNYIEEIAITLFILRALQYKVDDQLILKFGNYNKKLSVLIGDFIKLLSESEKLDDLLVRFHWNYIPEKFHKNIYDILLYRFLKNQDFVKFQNVAFLKDILSKHYKDYNNLIKQKLSLDEEWINIIGFGSKFYKCHLKDNTCEETPFDRRQFEVLLRRFYYEKQYYRKSSIYFEELLDLYSKLFIIRPKTKNYIWINGFSKFAPIKYNENVFFIFNLETFKFIRKPYSYSLKQLYLSNLDLPLEYIDNLKILIRFKNQFAESQDRFYITTGEIKNQYNVYIKLLYKNNISFPLYNKININLELPENSYGISLFSFNPYNALFIINHYFTPENIEIIQRLKKLYKFYSIDTNLYDIYFIKPYVNMFVQ
ncbi:MAG: hypothetical protein KatS3mg129_2104 [Leptospiraceae bacterium]|nr:MAG: hypothetical protein KatS3mg129_2104 [Leptospiraceae bacterium]